jgi:hypothetical protein
MLYINASGVTRIFSGGGVNKFSNSDEDRENVTRRAVALLYSSYVPIGTIVYADDL